MKKSRFSDSRIMAILQQAEQGVPVAELCREPGMSNASFYNGIRETGYRYPAKLNDETR